VNPAKRSAPTRVQLRQERVLARLKQAASQVIAEKGVEGLRLRDVTEIADVGFGSFYSHFASKEQLVEAVVTDLVVNLADATIARTARLADPAEAASAAHRWFVRQAFEAPEFAWLVVHLDRADALFERAILPYAEELLRRGIEAGRFRVMDVRVTLTYVVGATFAVMRAVLEGRLGDDADVTSAEALLGALGLREREAAEVARRALPAESAPER
jgi:AcrR family transcriptional regulator